MDTYSSNESLRQAPDASDVTEKGFAKNSYVSPRLIEYGSFTKLTGGIAQGSLENGTMSSICL
jgi:hypothetical protein